MAASQKIFVCGRCSDYGAPNLEELVTHMTNCSVPEIRKKDETSHFENEEDDDDDNDLMFDESENSEGAIEYADISEEKESPEKQKILDGSYVSTQSGYHRPYVIDTGRTSPTPFLWSKKTALLLLNLLKSHKDDMESPYMRKKTVWQKIALEMQEKYGYSVSATQCENKFKNMSNRYRRARNSNLPLEKRVKQTCFLYNELDEYFKNDARFHSKMDSVRDSNDVTQVFSPRVIDMSAVITPKIIEPSKYIDSNQNCDENITISEGENSCSFKDSNENEAEPVWVKKMVATFERCHRENMKMQREFIDVLKKILEKK